MGHANIYIRKENEKAWEALLDKSAWVNERLEKDDFVVAPKMQRFAGDEASEVTSRDLDWNGPIYRDKKTGKLWLPNKPSLKSPSDAATIYTFSANTF